MTDWSFAFTERQFLVLTLDWKGTVIETFKGWDYFYFVPSSSDGSIQKYSKNGHESGSYVFNHNKVSLKCCSMGELARNKDWTLSRRGEWTVVKSKGSDFCLYLNGRGFVFVMSNGAGMAVENGVCRQMSSEEAAVIVDQGKELEAVTGEVITCIVLRLFCLYAEFCS
jgi:hypothetical protein